MSATDTKHVTETEKSKLPPNQLNPSYTLRVVCCVLFIFLTEVCLAHYVYRLINSEIRAEYISKEDFRNGLLAELQRDEVRRVLREMHDTER